MVHGHGVRVVNQVHDDGAGAVRASVLGQVVGPRKLLAALVALEWLVLGVEGAVMALEVLLATEPPAAQLADKCLGRVLRQRLLAAAAIARGLLGRRGSVAVVVARRRIGLGMVIALVRCVVGLLLLLGRRSGLLLGAVRLRLRGRVGDGGAGVHPLSLAGVRLQVVRVVGEAKVLGLEGLAVKVLEVGAAEARVAEGRGVGAGARTSGEGGCGNLLLQVKQAVDQGVLGLESLVDGRRAVCGCTGKLKDCGWREREGKGGCLDERLVPEHKLEVLVVVTETGGRSDADREIARIAKVNVSEIVGWRRDGRRRE